MGGMLLAAGSSPVGAHDLTVLDGTAGTLGDVFNGMASRVSVLHLHDEALHAAGEVGGFAGTEHRVVRMGSGGWAPVGEGFESEVLGPTTFNGGLLAGAAFTGISLANGPSIRHVTRFNGVAWSQFLDGLDCIVRTFREEDGEPYATRGRGEVGRTIIPRFGLARTTGAAAAGGPMMRQRPGPRSIVSADGPSENHISSIVVHGGGIIVGGSMCLVGRDLGWTIHGAHLVSYSGAPEVLDRLTPLNGAVGAAADHQGALVIGGNRSSVCFPGIAGYWSGIDRPLRSLGTGLPPNPAADRSTIAFPEALGMDVVWSATDMTGRTMEARSVRVGRAVWMGGSALPAWTCVVEASVMTG